MVLVTPKYPGLDPNTFQVDPSGKTPWSHIQILGGRQLVAFDSAGAIVGTIDLALTSDLKIIRQAGIVKYAAEGSQVRIQYEAPAPVVKSQADGYSDDDEADDDYDDYGYSD